MKKILTILLTLVAVCANAQTSIWSGSKAIDWNTSTFESISADKFSSLEVADKIRFTFTITGNPSTWPQIALQNSSWKSLPGCGNAQLSDGKANYDITTYDFYVTNDMLTDIKAGGVIVTGAGYTVTDISIVKGTGAADYQNAVWIGSTDATTSWVATTVPASSFTNAKVGQYLRLYYEDLKAGAQHTIVDGNWKTITGYDYYQLSGIYYQYDIDEALLKVLQSSGIIINGTGYRLTHVDIVDPAALTQLTGTAKNNGWLFENKDPEITVTVTNPLAESTDATVKLIVKTDKMEAYTTVEKTVTLEGNSSQEVTQTFTAEPGFYNITPTLNGEPVYTANAFSDGNKSASFIIGVDPTKVVSAPDMQDDFDSFWSDTKAELAKIEPEYTLTELTNKSTSKRKVYLLEFKSLTDMGDTAAIARAYYAEPVAAGKYPALIHYQGYDGGTGDPWCMGGDDNPNYIEMVLATRGQLINNRAPYVNNYGDWFQYGFGNKDTYYYRGAFMDAIRAIEFIRSRDVADTENIFAEGSSQGGALTYAAAALTDHPFCAIAPSIPFLGDYPDYFEVASWPAYPAHQQQKALGMSDEDMYKFLSYFDTKNLATKIHCPVIQTIGLQDNVCPPHTNMAPYNNLPSDVEKQISYNALLMHTVPSSWYTAYADFFKNHMVTSGIENVNAEAENADNAIYNISGVRVSPSKVQKGVYICNGKKFVLNK